MKRSIGKKPAQSQQSKNVSIFVLFVILIVVMVYYFGLILISIDFLNYLFEKIKSMLLGRSIYFLFRLLGLYSAFLWVSVICTLFSPIEGLSVGGGGASSSERPSFDLNLPPADEPEPAVEQGPIPLSQAEEKILFRLTQPAEPRNMGQLYVEARKIAQNKGELVDLMVELDRDAPDFWRHHRDDIISDSILTNRKTEYGSKVLSDMVAELRGERGCKCKSDCFTKMTSIKKKFLRLGTFSY